MICKKCKKEPTCDMAQLGGHNTPISACYKFDSRTQTNGDRIREMRDEELADIICDHACMLCPLGTCEGRITIGRDACYKRWLDWLRQEVDEWK